MPEYKIDTLAVHAGTDKNQYGTCNTPIYQASAYRFTDADQAARRFDLKEGGPIYTRIGNPTEDALEARLTALFGGPTLAVASGSAAVLYSILNIAHAGDCILAAKNVYGGTFDLFSYTLPNMGIKVHWFDPKDLEENTDIIEGLIRMYQPKAIFAETVANPNATITDIGKVISLSKQYKIVSIIDNTFVPLLCDPIALGADVVVHSCTKFICGNGTTMGGCIIENPETDWSHTYLNNPDPSYHGQVFTSFPGPFTTRARCVILRDTGACISPFNAWCLLNGLETLPLRMERHVENTKYVIDFLTKRGIKINHDYLNNSEVYNKYVKGIASIFTIEVGKTKEDAQKFCNNLKLFYQVANVGDAKSLVTHPATTTHSQLSEEELAMNNITPTTVRLSIGIENKDDIITDISFALGSI